MIWMYRNKFSVSHMFHSIHRTIPVCGTTRSPYNYWDWKYDEEGLKKQRECKNCIRFYTGDK